MFLRTRRPGRCLLSGTAEVPLPAEANRFVPQWFQSLSDSLKSVQQSDREFGIPQTYEYHRNFGFNTETKFRDTFRKALISLCFGVKMTSAVDPSSQFSTVERVCPDSHH